MNIQELHDLLDAMESAGFNQRERNSERMRAIAKRLLATRIAGAQGGETIYQISLKVPASTAWIDVEKSQYDDAGLYAEYNQRTLYAHPQPMTDAARDALKRASEICRAWSAALIDAEIERIEREGEA